MPSQYKKISPVGTQVLVKVAEAETKTAGGILLAESSQRKPTSGDVAEFGDKCVGMKKGVTVLYNKFGIGCVDIEMGGETYILIREEDLIGTFPGSGATANDIPKLTPLGDRVMLKTDTVSTTTAGGIMLTDGAVEKPCTGVIVSVGPGKRVEGKDGKDGEEDEVKKPSTKKGDKVMYFKYAGDKMYDSEGAEYIVLADRDILATM